MGFNSACPPLAKLVLEQKGCESADLLSRETVERKAYFDWGCRDTRRRGS
ncbi:MAG: hypothetical protein V3R89_01360 [Thermoanaerobaculia bacterium]